MSDLQKLLYDDVWKNLENENLSVKAKTKLCHQFLLQAKKECLTIEDQIKINESFKKYNEIGTTLGISEPGTLAKLKNSLRRLPDSIKVKDAKKDSQDNSKLPEMNKAVVMALNQELDRLLDKYDLKLESGKKDEVNVISSKRNTTPDQIVVGRIQEIIKTQREILQGASKEEIQTKISTLADRMRSTGITMYSTSARNIRNMLALTESKSQAKPAFFTLPKWLSVNKNSDLASQQFNKKIPK